MYVIRVRLPNTGTTGGVQLTTEIMALLWTVILCVSAFSLYVCGNKAVKLEYEYSVKREQLLDKEKELSNNNLVLNDVSW